MAKIRDSRWMTRKEAKEGTVEHPQVQRQMDEEEAQLDTRSEECLYCEGSGVDDLEWDCHQCDGTGRV